MVRDGRLNADELTSVEHYLEGPLRFEASELIEDASEGSYRSLLFISPDYSKSWTGDYFKREGRLANVAIFSEKNYAVFRYSKSFPADGRTMKLQMQRQTGRYRHGILQVDLLDSYTTYSARNYLSMPRWGSKSDRLDHDWNLRMEGSRDELFLKIAKFRHFKPYYGSETASLTDEQREEFIAISNQLLEDARKGEGARFQPARYTIPNRSLRALVDFAETSDQGTPNLFTPSAVVRYIKPEGDLSDEQADRWIDEVNQMADFLKKRTLHQIWILLQNGLTTDIVLIPPGAGDSIKAILMDCNRFFSPQPASEKLES